MSSLLKNYKNVSVSGWGQTNKTNLKIIEPNNIEEIQDIIKKSPSKSLIARGLGRSYGDAAQLANSFGLNLNSFKKIDLDAASGIVSVGAGVSFDELLKKIVPLGFFIPVSPGTKNVTIGGAISADVHGKNHHVDGSFGVHLKEIKIIDGKGNINIISPEKFGGSQNCEYFWATIGGMGLLGVILEAKFSLIPISTSLMKVDTTKFKDLDSLMEAMINADKNYRYSVAWVDSMNLRGRGVLTCGDHLSLEDYRNNSSVNPLIYDPKSLLKAPSFLPGSILNQFTIRAFNEGWYRKSPLNKKNEIQTIPQYFYPLDGMRNWNNLYGPRGFIQYQFMIKDSKSFLISKVLDTLRNIYAYSFLTVLKRFGPSNKAPLSFPDSGWTLAIDIPAKVPNLLDTLDNIDQLIASNDGSIYLAKDSRMSTEIFRKMYPLYSDWKRIKEKVDPNQIFHSDLAERLCI